ncbi:hypothetical protein FPSE_11275, partial [Fusarium pseudograminearum CS3096]
TIKYIIVRFLKINKLISEYL